MILPMPYYDADGITLYCGDCREILPLFPAKSFDLVLTDPPYGIDYKSNWTTHQHKIENDKFDDWLGLLSFMFSEFKRLLTDTGCCCCCCGGGKTPVTAIATLEAIKYMNLIQTLVWVKFIGLGWRYRPAYENILVLSNDKATYNFYDTSKVCANVIQGINQDIPVKGEHPTQKPVQLISRLLLIHSLKEHTILDPFCGSGTTLVAAKQLGRKAVGIEISQKYCVIAVERLKQRELL